MGVKTTLYSVHHHLRESVFYFFAGEHVIIHWLGYEVGSCWCGRALSVDCLRTTLHWQDRHIYGARKTASALVRSEGRQLSRAHPRATSLADINWHLPMPFTGDRNRSGTGVCGGFAGWQVSQGKLVTRTEIEVVGGQPLVDPLTRPYWGPM